MEHKEQEKFALRESKQSRYDKRLIMKIVNEVENGLPRKEANRIYELGKTTLDSWMKDYGSPEYHEEIKRKYYSKLQKRTIITAIEQGRISIREAKIAYKIRSEKIIRGWLSEYKSEKVEICIENTSPMAKEDKDSTQSQNEALQKALQEAELKVKALNTLIDVAEEQLKIDIRKKSGAKRS